MGSVSKVKALQQSAAQKMISNLPPSAVKCLKKHIPKACKSSQDKCAKQVMSAVLKCTAKKEKMKMFGVSVFTPIKLLSSDSRMSVVGGGISARVYYLKIDSSKYSSHKLFMGIDAGVQQVAHRRSNTKTFNVINPLFVMHLLGTQTRFLPNAIISPTLRISMGLAGANQSIYAAPNVAIGIGSARDKGLLGKLTLEVSAQLLILIDKGGIQKIPTMIPHGMIMIGVNTEPQATLRVGLSYEF
ncbi:MAG: hypothetical protein ABIE74_12055 [Pseudomonadota bacterium]